MSSDFDSPDDDRDAQDDVELEQPLTESDLDRLADHDQPISAVDRRRLVEEVRAVRGVLEQAYEYASSADDFGRPLLAVRESRPSAFLSYLRAFVQGRVPRSRKD
jgi:hypothetical protein